MWKKTTIHTMIRTTYTQLTTVEKALVCYKIMQKTRADATTVEEVLLMVDPQVKVIMGEVIVWYSTLQLIQRTIERQQKKNQPQA